MGVNAPNHGSLRHEDLKVGHEVLRDGEKVRPTYNGTILKLATAVSPKSTDLQR